MERYYEAIDLLKGMISRPSFSRDETAVADFLQAEWQKAGQKVFRKGNNLWIIAPDFDFGKPTLLLNSHIDTVKPASGWTKDPFTPEETEDDQLYGLGSNDAGASVVSLYQAFCILSEKEQPYNLIFLASCEEEVSGKNGIESALAELPPISFAVVGEPTGMQPVVAEKGLMVLDCTAIGKAGHAARNEGINAEFTVDIRTNEFYTNEQLFELIKEKVHCEIKARSFRLSSTRTDLDHPFVRRAILMGKEPFGSPTLSDQALMRFPSVKIGPGNSARSHSADEYIKGPEIREAIDTYVRLLNGLQL